MITNELKEKYLKVIKSYLSYLDNEIHKVNENLKSKLTNKLSKNYLTHKLKRLNGKKEYYLNRGKI